MHLHGIGRVTIGAAVVRSPGWEVQPLSAQPPTNAFASANWMPRELFGYEVIDKIGEGAASKLYVVSEPKTHQLYALKHITLKTEKDFRFLEQLENEYNVSKDFKHPALRRAIDFKTNKSLLRKPTEAVLVLELFDGVPIAKQPPRELAEVLHTFIAVAKGLDAMHYMRLVHCDMKPENILTNPNGVVKVIDFGQTCPIATVKERIQGTPDFIAPEQVEKRPVTVRTDVFNFGATLYWALCGHKIPTLITIKKREREHLRDHHITPPIRLNPAVPQALSDLVMQCIRLDPVERPRGMGDVVKALDAIARDLAPRPAPKA